MFQNPIQIILVYFTKLLTIFFMLFYIHVQDWFLASDTISIFFRNIILRIRIHVIYFPAKFKEIRIFSLFVGLLWSIGRCEVHWQLLPLFMKLNA